jgi:hypothetical protein
LIVETESNHKVTQRGIRRYLSTIDLALVSFFSAFWIALNFTVAPIGFRLFGLPVVHSIIAFLTLLLTVWATGKYGAATIVGMVGSAIVLLAGGPLPVIGFAASSILFDAILIANRHKINRKLYSTAIVLVATVICSYFAGVINGVLILNLKPVQFAVTIWASWTVVGGLIGLAVTLPVIAALEKADVKKVKSD